MKQKSVSDLFSCFEMFSDDVFTEVRLFEQLSGGNFSTEHVFTCLFSLKSDVDFEVISFHVRRRLNSFWSHGDFKLIARGQT